MGSKVILSGSHKNIEEFIEGKGLEEDVLGSVQYSQEYVEYRLKNSSKVWKQIKGKEEIKDYDLVIKAILQD